VGLDDGWGVVDAFISKHKIETLTITVVMRLNEATEEAMEANNMVSK